MRRRIIFNLVLGILCAAAAGHLAWMLVADPVQSTAPSAQGATAVTMAAPPSFIAPSRSAFAEVDQRPLISPSRRPGLPQNAPTDGGVKTKAVPPAPPALNLVLLGIVGEPIERIAVLKTPSSQIAVDVKVGGIVDGWQILEIGADWISVRANSSDQIVKLQYHGGATGSVSSNPSRPIPMTGQQSQKTR